ncbi:hypothetical protein QTN25_007920 [Entamoeba marina]
MVDQNPHNMLGSIPISSDREMNMIGMQQQIPSFMNQQSRFNVTRTEKPIYMNDIQQPTTQQKKTEKKKRKNEHRPEHREDMLKEIAQEIYIRWKVRKLVKERGYNEERAEKKAEKRWKKETADVTRLFYKAAIMENTMLGDEDVFTKKRKKEAKIKENCHPYLLFCKEHREQLSNKHNGKDILTILSSMWKKLDPSEKAKYVDSAKRNKLLQTSTHLPNQQHNFQDQPVDQLKDKDSKIPYNDPILPYH